MSPGTRPDCRWYSGSWRSRSSWPRWRPCRSTPTNGRAPTRRTRRRSRVSRGAGHASHAGRAARPFEDRLAYCRRTPAARPGAHEVRMDARILLVEDDPSIREVTAIGLRNAGFTIETAPDGAAGLEQFAAATFDLVLLDVMLPRIDGLEVCRTIRRTSTVPIEIGRAHV